jgi:hypothetical protein
LLQINPANCFYAISVFHLYAMSGICLLYRKDLDRNGPMCKQK